MSAGVGSALGVAWYTPEAWVQLEAMPEARIEKSYADFVRAFGRIVRELEPRGVRAVKVTIDVAAMTEWCHRNGYEVDGTGRTVYCAMLTMARDDPDMLNKPVVDNVTRSVQ